MPGPGDRVVVAPDVLITVTPRLISFFLLAYVMICLPSVGVLFVREVSLVVAVTSASLIPVLLLLHVMGVKVHVVRAMLIISQYRSCL